MKLIIEVTEALYETCKEWQEANVSTWSEDIIARGTPLPEGRLIDADKLIKTLEEVANLEWNIQVGSSKGLEDAIDFIYDAPTATEGSKDT